MSSARAHRPPLLALAYPGLGDVRPHLDRYGACVSPRLPRRRVLRLRRCSYRLITLEPAERVRDACAAACAAPTLDDGLADHFHRRVPLLEVQAVVAGPPLERDYPYERVMRLWQARGMTRRARMLER